MARLELMLDLEALMVEPKGLRFDPSLPMPTGPLVSSPNDPEVVTTPELDLERIPELRP